MAGLLKIRDTIRDFLRKYDEITTPLYRFVIAMITFSFLNSMFGYSELFQRSIVVFLLSVISALVSNPVMVLLAGAVVLANACSVSLEVGAAYLILFVIVYCMYIRIFPHCSWILIFVPIMFHLRLIYAVPIIIAMFAGASGIVPAFFGILLYRVAVITKDIPNLMDSADEEEFQAYTYIVEQLDIRNIVATAVVFAVVIMITYVIYRMSFDYSWYVAIGVGGVCNILFFMLSSVMADVDVEAGSLIFGSLLGVLLACVLQLCKSVVDYSRKESVQFEDDDYYYYVKAIPKFNSKPSGKDVKKMTEETAKRMQDERNRGKQQNQGQSQGRVPVREREETSTARPERSRQTSDRMNAARPANPARPANSARSANSVRPEGSARPNTNRQGRNNY